jgi:YfiH family protein
VRFVDGLVCDIPRVPLLQLSADCLLILAVDPNRRAFGTAHASWRGTVGGVARNLVRMMVHSFETRPADLLVGLAPSACPPRYEIGEDVRRVAEAMLTDAGRFMPASPSGRHCFDLKAANADQLLGSGVPAGRIVIAAECTMADPRFYSHRRDGDTTGRFALIAGFTA